MNTSAESEPLVPTPAPPPPVTLGVTVKVKLPVLSPLLNEVFVVKFPSVLHTRLPVPLQAPNEEPVLVWEFEADGIGVNGSPL